METFNTCYSTPYGALGLDLSKNYYDRTAVQNYKTAFSFLSLLVPSLLMLVFLGDHRTVDGYLAIAAVTSTLCILCAIVCFAGTYKHRTLTVDTPKVKEDKRGIAGIFEDFFGIIRQKNVGRLIAGYAISLSAGAFLTSLGLHVFTYTFNFSTKQIPIVMICLIAGIIVGQPLWYHVSRKTDKITALLNALGMLLVCMAVFALVMVFRSFIPINSALVLISMVIFACGLGTGCLYALPISMYADCIALQKEKTGIDKTGKSAGFLTFCTKISNAFILFTIGLSLDIIGFNGRVGAQSLNVQNWLGYLLVVGVSVTCVVAMLIYSKYTYTKDDFAQTL